MERRLHLACRAGVWPVLLLMVASACEAPFEPLTETETEFFAVFGFLDADADTQFVRVSPLRPALDPGTTPEGTEVVSRLAPAGDPLAWQDSLIRLDDGTTGLLFFTPTRVQPGSRYRLEIAGPRGDMTTATTTVPAQPTLRIGPVRSIGNDFHEQDVAWEDVVRAPVRVTLAYLVQLPGSAEPDTVIVTYRETGQPVGNDWSFPIDLSAHREEVLARLDRPSTDRTLVLNGIAMTIEQRSAEWFRQEPVNITGGFGFFGSLGTTTRTWTLSPAVVRDVGFQPPPGPAPERSGS